MKKIALFLFMMMLGNALLAQAAFRLGKSEKTNLISIGQNKINFSGHSEIEDSKSELMKNKLPAGVEQLKYEILAHPAPAFRFDCATIKMGLQLSGSAYMLLILADFAYNFLYDDDDSSLLIPFTDDKFTNSSINMAIAGGLIYLGRVLICGNNPSAVNF